jgi:hypothetical protein
MPVYVELTDSLTGEIVSVNVSAAHAIYQHKEETEITFGADRVWVKESLAYIRRQLISKEGIYAHSVERYTGI